MRVRLESRLRDGQDGPRVSVARSRFFVAASPQSQFQKNHENDPRKTPLASALRPRHLPRVLAANGIYIHHEEAVAAGTGVSW